jgi:uncharacterized SAM-binding protein YcdF (DUF218 family)
MRTPLVLAGTAGAALLRGELVHWRASLALTHSAAGETEAVVVLGFRNRNRERANMINRWRVRAGLRSIDPRARSSRLVLCGAAYHRGGLSEAALMARYARKERGFTGDLLIEEESRSTWQNVANAIPLIEGTDRIKVVSHSVHAQRARLYLQHQRPDLAHRMVRADYRLGEWVLLKPLFAVYELLKMAKAKRTLNTDRGRQARREDDYLGRDGDVVEFRHSTTSKGQH